MWAVAAATVLSATAGHAPGASGSVIRVTVEDAVEASEHLESTLLAPDGTARDLPDLPLSVAPRDQTAFVADPTGTLLAQPTGTRLSLVPVNGGPVRSFSGAAQARGPVAPVVWWNADGSALATGPARTTRHQRAIRWCTIATLTCRLDRIGNRTPAGALPDGRVLEVSTYDALKPALFGAYTRWETRTEGWVRRQRRIVVARRANKLWADAGPGAGRTVLRDLSGRAAAGFTDISVAEDMPAPSSDGQLLSWQTIRLTVQTRVRRGAREARVRQDIVRAGVWLVRPDGRIRSLPRLAASGAVPERAVPGEGWLGTLTRDGGRIVPVRIALDGRVSALRVSGANLTPQRLHAALGLPEDQRPPTGKENADFVGATVSLQGYEPATHSAVVSYTDPYSVTVARVPLDGQAPTLVERHRGSATYLVR
jgi:hypothetical protein